jgi:hypothetical protein
MEALLELEYKKALHRVIPRSDVHEPAWRECRLAMAIARAEVAEAILVTPREVAA